MKQDKKKQHYIPRFYLKSFSVDTENLNIGVYKIRYSYFNPKVSIAYQAQEEYFYGKDGFLEDQLSKIESMAAPILQRVMTEDKLPLKSTPDYLKIFCFFIFLCQRTKVIARGINENVKESFNLLIQDNEILKEEFKDCYLSYEPSAELALILTARYLPMTFDLKTKLIVNKTTTKFIISDNPCVKYNQFLEQRKHVGGKSGIATRGLQIYCPISPNHLVLFYDDWVYKIGDKKQEVIEIHNLDVIQSLNVLQVLNCNECIYFNEEISEAYVRQLISMADLEKEKSSNNERRFYKKITETILEIEEDSDILINLKLSFITLTKRAKALVLSPDSLQLRNENYRALLLLSKENMINNWKATYSQIMDIK